MVQEIAKEMIRQARQEGAQDIYLIPKTTCYELYRESVMNVAL